MNTIFILLEKETPEPCFWYSCVVLFFCDAVVTPYSLLPAPTRLFRTCHSTTITLIIEYISGKKKKPPNDRKVRGKKTTAGILIIVHIVVA